MVAHEPGPVAAGDDERVGGAARLDQRLGEDQRRVEVLLEVDRDDPAGLWEVELAVDFGQGVGREVVTY